jgi:phage shock protein A
MTTDRNAITALVERRKNLKGQVEYNERERDRLQEQASRFQYQLDRCQAEIVSIEAALKLLEAADQYNKGDDHA